MPKQLLPLTGDATLLQQTASRLADAELFAPLRVIGASEHRFVIAEQLRALGAAHAEIALEPAARDTAAAAAIAALMVERAEGANAIVALLASDHAIADRAAFERSMRAAARAAASGWITTFGMEPSRPETGYGWIEAGAPLDGAPGVRRIRRFVEKPPLAEAERLLASGGHYWNSGMFVFAAGAMIGELRRLAPEILSAARAALDGATGDLDFLRLERAAFERAPSAPIDKAVMEKTDRAAVAPSAMGWSDVGSWASLWEIGEKDARGNVVSGAVCAVEAERCYLRAEQGVLAAIGVEDLAIVSTGDAVLVTPKDRAQDVKRVVERLTAAGRPEALAHRRLHRPWGHRDEIEAGPSYRLGALTIGPGRRISLHRHARRAEHWIALSGTTMVELDDETHMLEADQSVFAPPGVAHRLSNPGDAPARLIEVRSGAYLDEDDIERLDDDYGRMEWP